MASGNVPSVRPSREIVGASCGTEPAGRAPQDAVSSQADFRFVAAGRPSRPLWTSKDTRCFSTSSVIPAAPESELVLGLTEAPVTQPMQSTRMELETRPDENE